MSRDANLPFERGDTYFGIGSGDAITSGQSDAVQHLLGKTYRVEDPDYNGRYVTLRIAQYNGTGDLTAAALLVDLASEAGLSFTDQAPGAGEQTYPLDHKYDTKVIRDLDLCYLIEAGPCEIEGGDTAAAGQPVGAATDGQTVTSQAGDQWIVGVMEETNAADTKKTVLVKSQAGIE